MVITHDMLMDFERYLVEGEKAKATIDKYLHDVREFARWLNDGDLCKTTVIEYKSYLCEHYASASVNAVISSLNSFFNCVGRKDLEIKKIKIQHRVFISAEKELTRAEYERLLLAAKKNKNERLYFLMQAICATGIRISELRFITVESLRCGEARITCKGKQRCVILPRILCKMLEGYVKKKKIKSGAVFITKNGKPLDRSNVWSDMKRLCSAAGVSEGKVFPHNLRHLFARTYYSKQKDIVRLADILGHSDVNTTRIYTMETGEIHRKQIQNLGLIRRQI